MIQVLGANRVILLVVLFLLLGATGGGLYGYLIPVNDKTERKLNGVNSQITSKKDEIRQLQQQIDQLHLLRADFEVLGNLGFFDIQDREQTKKRLDLVTELSKVSLARYNVGKGIVEINENADKTGYVVLKSAININVQALDDLDIYKFIYWVENGFPGHVSLSSLDMRRVNEVTPVNLKKIGRGGPLALMDSTLNFVWRTMVLPEDVETKEGGAQ